MFMALTNNLVVLFYCCATADILRKLLQPCFLFFIIVRSYLDNSQVSVYRTIGPTLVLSFSLSFSLSLSQSFRHNFLVFVQYLENEYTE